MNFDLLSPELVSVLAEKGITSPTPPQEDAIPRIKRGEHVLIVAPTGIGKTEAAMLPILDSIHRSGDGAKGFRCIYITPLRALNRDMLRRMEDYGRALGIKVGVRHGDTTQHERAKQSEDPPEILITTPETLQVLFTGKRLAKHLAAVRWVVVDEIHEMADTERGAQLSVAMERLSLIAGDYQRIDLSATVGDAEAVAMFLGGRGRRVSIRKFNVSNRIRVTMPDVEQASNVIDVAIKNGATGVDGLSLSYKDEAAAVKKARTLAIENARAIAEESCGAAGTRLGKVLVMEELSSGARPPYMALAASNSISQTWGGEAPVYYDSGDASDATPISSGKKEIRVVMSIVYELR
ncbi:MAG: SIMPL domain-containing protein [Candidatus Methanomethylophilaceae archaeon]|nr:SIMPL domain-containing protein [Candidatus Methanomethylophilaceae archaeon]